MRTTSLIAVLLATVTACLGAVLLAGQSTAAPPAGARAWEYRTVFESDLTTLAMKAAQQANRKTMDTADALNALGADGWEMAGVRVGGSKNEGVTYYFKRPK